MKRVFVLLFLGIIFLGCAGCHSRSKDLSGSGAAIQSKTGTITESDLGVPFYPGATAEGDQSFIFKGNSEKGKPRIRTTSVSFTTTDSIEKVEGFYREKLGRSAKITEHVSANGKLVDILLARGQEEIRLQIVPEASNNGSVIVILTQSR